MREKVDISISAQTPGAIRSRGPLPFRRAVRRAGFTLIEILIAVTILAVGVLGISMLQTNSLSGEILTRDMDSAISLASDALDRIQASSGNISDYVGGDYGAAFTVTTTSSSPSGVTAYIDHDALQEQMINMNLTDATLSVSFQTDTPVTGVDTATATVTWSHKGSPKECEVKSIIVR